jgi:hypothetical protein
MRKISIVQRRLEAGFNLTRAELRALKRENPSDPDDPQSSESAAQADSKDLFPFSSILNGEPETNLPEQEVQHSSSENGPSQGYGEVPLAASTQERLDQPGMPTLVRTAEPEPIPQSWERIADKSADAGSTGISKTVDEPASPVSFQSTHSGLFGKESEFGLDGPLTTPSQVATRADEQNDPGLTGQTLFLFLLQMAQRDGFAATFEASECADSPFAGQLRLRSRQNGSTLSSSEETAGSEFDVNLPADGLVRLTTGRLNGGEGGWALVTLDGKARRHATFDLRSEKDLKATAAVFGDTPVRKAELQVITDPKQDKGLVVANPTDTPVLVKLRLIDEQGFEVADCIREDLKPLLPGRQVALFATDCFGEVEDINDFKGKMIAEVVGKGVIWVAGLNQLNGELSFLPAEEIQQANY